MGLPARWNHPELGECLTLHAALAHLAALGIPARAEGKSIVIERDGAPPVTLTPTDTPMGKMFPLSALVVGSG